MSELNFSTLMASSVHDIKNMLSSVLESVDWLSRTINTLNDEQKAEFTKVNKLIFNANSELMQLLCFFKFDNKQYNFLMKEVNLEEFLQMQVDFLEPMKNQKLKLEVNCELDLAFEFDEILIATAVRNAIFNALKYAKSKIVIFAEKTQDFLKISVEDDGPGFPEKMLGKIEREVTSIGLNDHSTGLGLYFAETIANLHRKNDKVGYAMLKASKNLNGAAFELFIP